jgi:lipoprotein Spr
MAGKGILWFSIMLALTIDVSGQRVDTLDYSFLKFGPLDSFYKANNIHVVEANNPDLYFEIYDWIGTTYRWGGKTKNGIDCSGFVSMAYYKLYHQVLGGAAIDIFKKCDEVMQQDLQEGDLLFFNINGKYLQHVGIYLQNGMFAHAATHSGVTVSSLSEAYYKRWFYKAGRVRQE